MLELFSLKDKVAVITGASRGLGKPMAKGLAAAGAHVVLVARDEARLNDGSRRDRRGRRRGHGPAASTSPTRRRSAPVSAGSDTNSDASISASTTRASSTGSRCSTATSRISSAIMDTNVKATFVMSQECAAIMRAGGRGGRIVNIGSMLVHARAGQASCLLRQQVGDRRPDPFARGRTRPREHHRERHRAGLFRHRHQRQPDVASRLRGGRQRGDADGALGQAGGTGRHAHLPRLRRIELRDRAGDPCGRRHRGHLHVPACCLREPI